MTPSAFLLALLLLPARDSAALDKNDFPPVLGGMVRSKKWVVRRDKGQEEFIGDVSYKNPSYVLKADWAQDDKKRELVKAKGSVYLRAVRKDGAVLESRSDSADYSRASGLAHFFAGPEPVNIICTSADSQTVLDTLSASAQVWEKTSAIRLEGDVRAVAKRGDGSQTRSFSDTADYNDSTGKGLLAMKTPQARVQVTHRDARNGELTALSRSTALDRNAETAVFEGEAALSGQDMSALSDTAAYNFKTADLQLSGSRPVVWGRRNGYDFAMQADSISLNRSSETLKADGRARGWMRKAPEQTAKPEKQ